MRTILTYLATVLLLFCANSAMAWEQTMTCDGICNDGSEPNPTYWKTPCIAFHLNEKGSKYIKFDQIKKITETSIKTWNRRDLSSLTPHFAGLTNENRIGYNPYIKDNANIIVFRDSGWKQDDRSIMALTTVTHKTSTGEIYDADIEINTTHWKFGVYETDGASVVDFQNTLTHEIGHAFGLSHSADTTATMFPYAGTGEISMRSLARDDLKAISTLYPPSTLNCSFEDNYFEQPPYQMNERPKSDDSCSAQPLIPQNAAFWPLCMLFIAATLRKSSQKSRKRL